MMKCSGGSLGHYWREFRNPKTPRFQGGFIWDFCDQGLLQHHRTTNGRPAYCYGGDFDDLPNTKQFCCNGLVGPSRELYPTAHEVSYLQAPVEVTLYFIGGSSSNSNSSYSNNPMYFDQETGSNSSTGDEPMLLITSRRVHASLADMEVQVTFYFHDPSFLVHEQGSDGM